MEFSPVKECGLLPTLLLTILEAQSGNPIVQETVDHHLDDCYEPFFSLTCVQHAFAYLFFIYDQTCIYLKANMSLTYVYLIFTLCFTCVHLKANTFLYLFKPVVRQLYSLAFH